MLSSTPHSWKCRRVEVAARKYPVEYRTSIGAPLKPLYGVWRNMLARCDPENGNHRYGGRGIRVTKEWYWWPTFAEWAVAAGWKQGLEIDRIDNDGNYCQENCRFVTTAENLRNRDKDHFAAVHREAQVKFHGKLFKCVETGEIFATQIDALRKHKVDRKTLRMALRGEYAQAGGLHWLYL